MQGELLDGKAVIVEPEIVLVCACVVKSHPPLAPLLFSMHFQVVHLIFTLPLVLSPKDTL